MDANFLAFTHSSLSMDLDPNAKRFLQKVLKCEKDPGPGVDPSSLLDKINSQNEPDLEYPEVHFLETTLSNYDPSPQEKETALLILFKLKGLKEYLLKGPDPRPMWREKNLVLKIITDLTDSLGTAPRDDIITQGVDFGLDVKEVEEILETLKNEAKIAHLAGEESFERI